MAGMQKQPFSLHFPIVSIWKIMTPSSLIWWVKTYCGNIENQKAVACNCGLPGSPGCCRPQSPIFLEGHLGESVAPGVKLCPRTCHMHFKSESQAPCLKLGTMPPIQSFYQNKMHWSKGTSLELNILRHIASFFSYTFLSTYSFCSNLTLKK